MPFVAPWLVPPNYLEASESGGRLGLSRDQMLSDASLRAAEIAARSAEAGAALGQRDKENAANLALEYARLKQAGLLGTQKLNNQENALNQRESSLTAREELDKAKADALGRNRFVNTGGGLMQQDPVTGQWSLVKGSTKPKTDIVPTYIPPVEAKDADVTPGSSGSWNPFNWGAGAHPAVTNSPAIQAVPGHWYNKRVEVPDDNAPASDALNQQSPVTNLPAVFSGGPPPTAEESLSSGPEQLFGGPTPSAADSLMNLPAQVGPLGLPTPQTGGSAFGQPKGTRVKNKKTGEFGTQLPDGTVIPDSNQ